MYSISIMKSNIELIDKLGITNEGTQKIVNEADATYYKPEAKLVAAIVDVRDKNDPYIYEFVNWDISDDACKEYNLITGRNIYPIFLQQK